jgi:GNAT superfamily N-acetyltransferase
MSDSTSTAETVPSRIDDFVLRPVADADAEAAAHVVRTAFAAQSRATRPPSSALRETEDSIAGKIGGGGGFGAFADGELVAVALWQVVDADALMIARVCVLPAFRGRSLSHELVAACEREARARGLWRARVRVRLELPENERLFSRMGFERLQIEAHAGFDSPTVAVLEKRLS